MTTARRIGRWALLAAGGLLALAVLVWVGVGIYLNTPAGRAFVAGQISNRINMPVQVTSVSVGFASSSIGLKLFDPHAANPAKAEVLSVESAKADISLFALARGDISPKTVELHNVNLQLHVGADGKILTTMPKMPEGGGGGAIPQINLTDGQITIDQDGRPEFAVHGLNLSVQPTGDSVNISGTVDDPNWSKWTVKGEVNTKNQTGSLTLASDDAPMTMDRLSSVPFVPEEVWKSAQPNGRGAASLKLTQGSDHEVRFEVDIRPKDVNLTIPAADVTLTKVTGELIVNDKVIIVKQGHAELAGGTIAVAGEFDYTAKPTVAKLNVTASGLDIRQLPAKWELPADFTGRLKGHADLTVKIYPDGRMEPLGGGEGSIEGAEFRGLPVTVGLKLQGNGKRYRFEKGSQTGMGGRPTGQPGEPTPPAPLPAGRGEKAFGGIAGPNAVVPEFSRGASCSPSLQGGGWGVGSPDGGLGLLADLAPYATEPIRFAQPKKGPASGSAPQTLEATIGLKDINISELLQKLNIKIGYKISGKVSASLAISVPVGGVTSSATYEFTGKITSPELQFEALGLRNVSMTATYKNGKLTLKELRAAVAQPDNPKAEGGTFFGNATAAITPPGDVTASLTLDRIPLGEVMKALPGSTIEVKGVVTGKADVKAPYKQLSDPTAWTGSAELNSPELVVAGRSAKNARLALVVAKGTATLKDLSATVEGIPVLATATLELTGKYPFTATLKTSGTDVADLRKLVPEAQLPAPVEGVLDTSTQATGTVSPFTFSASGTVSATKLTLAKTPANSVAIKWQLTTERLVVSSLKASVFGGTLAGNADVPFAPDKAGSFLLTFKDIDLAAAAPLIPDFPVKIGGNISGDIKGEITPAKEGGARVGNLNVDITSPKLTVQGIPADRLVGKAAIKNGVLEYSLEGKTLGGSFELKGRYPGQKKNQGGPANPAPAPAPVRAGWGGGVGLESSRHTPCAVRCSPNRSEVPHDATRPRSNGTRSPGLRPTTLMAQPPKYDSSFRLTGADLSLAASQLGIKSLAPLRGRLDVNFDFNADLSAGAGRIRLTGVTWNTTSITRELSIVVALKNGVLEVTEVNGSVAGGFVRGRGLIRLKEAERNYFSITVEGADAKRLLAVVPEVAEKVDGPVTVLLQGHVGREMRASGAINVTRGTISGVAVNDLQIPFTYSSYSGFSRLAVRGAKLNAGTGTLQADLTLESGVETRIAGLVKFINVPLRTISPGLGEYSLIGNGRITGRFSVAGTNVRSVDDLTGSLIATLGNTSPREIPLIQQAVPFLNTAGAVRPFNSGDVRGTLNRGVFRVQRLALYSPNAQLFADGTVSLSGRVDLNVIAHTGAIGPASGVFGILAARIPAIGPIPVSLLTNLSAAISNTTIRLSITGTTSNPVVKVNVAALITEEAVRFLISRYIPIQYTDAAGIGNPLDFLGGMRP